MIPSENEVGHPITNMLMRQANAADMATADHADGAGVDLEKVGHIGPLETLSPYAEANKLPPEAQEAFDEIEHLVEGARQAIVQRLDQFDGVEQRTVVIAADLVRLEGKLDLLLSHFGLLNTGS